MGITLILLFHPDSYPKPYTFSHNHGSGTWLYLKGTDPIGDAPIFDATMIMGGSVTFNNKKT